MNLFSNPGKLKTPGNGSKSVVRSSRPLESVSLVVSDSELMLGHLLLGGLLGLGCSDWIDPDTPQNAKVIYSRSDGRKYNLVFR